MNSKDLKQKLQGVQVYVFHQSVVWFLLQYNEVVRKVSTSSQIKELI